MTKIQDELAALRSRKLTSKEAVKLKDAAPMSNPVAMRASLKDHKTNLKHVDAILPATTAPSAAVNMETNFYLKQNVKKQEEKKMKEAAAHNLRGYKAPAPKAEANAALTKKVKVPSASTKSEEKVPPVAADPKVETAAPSPSVETIDDEIPNLEELDDVPDLEASDFSQPVNEPKTNRSEKKSRKMMQKLGMRPVPGIVRATFKASRQGVFVIDNPDVFSASGKTFVVFGEAKNQGSQAAAAAAARNFQIPQQDQSVEVSDAVPDHVASEEEEEVDETGVDAKDVDLVMSQAGCSRAKAVHALKGNDGDLVNAIMALTT